MGQKVTIKYGANFLYRLRPKTISPLSADLSATTHVFHSPFNAQPDIFAVMNCCVVALSLFSSDSPS